jgi:dihydroorotase
MMLSVWMMNLDNAPDYAVPCAFCQRRLVIDKISGFAPRKGAVYHGGNSSFGGIMSDIRTMDLLIKNGLVVDPSQGLHAHRDIALRGGKVAEVAADLSALPARRVIDASGLIVVPGLVDLHVHLHWGVSHYGVEADLSCLARGVTTVAEAGSAGAYTYPSLKRYIIDRAQTRILAFLNVAWMGMIGDEVGELEDMRFINRDVAVRVGAAPEIVGFKARMDRVGPLRCTEPLVAAVEIARAANKPLMVHIGRDVRMKATLAEILDLLAPGDIITHCYHGHPGGILDDDTGQLRPEVLAARERGILFDVGHGGGSYTFAVARGAMEQGLLPDIISSDLHTSSIAGPVFDLPTTMSKFLHLGMTLDEVVERCTVAPARVLGLEGAVGTLRPGAIADVTLLALRDGEFDLVDCARQVERASQLLTPEGVVKDGQIASMGPVL